MNCTCGEKLETQIGSGYTIFHCPKGHYERHEADRKFKGSAWLKDLTGWEPAPEPARMPNDGSIASALVHDTLLWADRELESLQREFPETDLTLPSWWTGQAELQKLTASSGVLEIKDAIEKYKHRVTAYLAKWRKKLQSSSPSQAT